MRQILRGSIIFSLLLSLLLATSATLAAEVQNTGNIEIENEYMISNQVFWQTGDIHVKPGGKLVLENTTLLMQGLGQRFSTVLVEGELQMVNSTVRSATDDFASSSVIFDGNARATVENSTLSHYVGFSGDVEATFINSRIWLADDAGAGIIGLGANANVWFENSIIAGIDLFLPDGATLEGELEPRLYERWALSAATQNVPFELVFENTEVRQYAGGNLGGFEGGWNVFASPSTRVVLRNSVLRKFNFQINNAELTFSNLRMTQPSDLSVDNITLENVTVQGSWGFFFEDSDLTVENVDGAWIWPIGTSNLVMRNSKMVEFDPREHAGKITFDNVRWEMIGGVEILENSDFEMEGSVQIMREQNWHASWSDSKLKRWYDVLVFQDGKSKSGVNLVVTHDGSIVWQGSTDDGGKARFAVQLTDGNWEDEFTIEGEGFQAKFSFYSSSPIEVELTETPTYGTLTLIVGLISITLVAIAIVYILRRK